MTSRFDYCNSILHGINGHIVSQLQRCQNNAVLILFLWRKYDHTTPVLKELPWLPVEQGINYKILLLAYKAQHGMASPYLLSLLSPYNRGRPLRSEGKHLLTTSPLIARFVGPTWGLSGADRTQVGPMLALWTLLSGSLSSGRFWQALLCACWPFPLEYTPYLHNFLSVQSIIFFQTLSRVVWRHICLMLHIHNATWFFYLILCVFLSGVSRCLLLVWYHKRSFLAWRLVAVWN